MIRSFKHGLLENERVVVEDMTVGELAERLKCSVNLLIVELLICGIVASKNQLIKKNQIIKILQDWNVQFVEPVVNTESALERVMEAKSSTGVELRLPVVAVIGHVNHGKTSFLDYLRKTKIVDKEKGGITQHVAAYEVSTKHGNLVFLDTPGHEAFSLMRERGVLIADLVVLVVALDDGVKPQTIESIKKIKEFGATTIVALNKVDKVKEDRIDIVKKQLVDQGIVPDEWGGDVPMIPISSKTGKGIDELLEVIRLQADILNLKTSSTQPAQGVILESMMEHGHGAVATIILHKGKLCKGDYFICGKSFGKVSSMENCFGKKLSCVGASVPIVVSGFSSLPEAGDIFEFAEIEQVKKHKSDQGKLVTVVQNRLSNDNTDCLNVIIKVKTLLSKDALISSLKKLNEKHDNKIKIIDAGIGDINEGNLELAVTTGSLVYGLGVKVNKIALTSMKKFVSVKTFDIIYKLLEDIEDVLDKGKKGIVTETPLGAARVKAIFKIKSIGTVAGAEVFEGSLQKNAKFRVLRGGVVIGGGVIKTLQRERSAAATVSAGSDCAFASDNFSGWKVGDEVRCYTETIS